MAAPELLDGEPGGVEREESVEAGDLVADEQHVLKMTLYFTDEISLMLERAGFIDVEVRGAYRDEPPTRDDEFVVFIARR